MIKINIFRAFATITLLFLLLKTSFAAVPAFPGAEGFGKYTTGGRGGRIIYVTSLLDTNTAGTLRYAINQSGPRIVVFKVSGTITLTSQLDIKNDNITIAGQTAPGDGICLRGYGVNSSANNVIIRYLRFRMGDTNDIESDAFGGRQRKNIIIDHCSVSWSIDECASFYDNQNFTMQWCLISESLRLSNHAKGPHGYAGIFGGRCATFHHNLLAHHDSRTPRFGSGVVNVGNDTVDYRNNVIYNWSGNGCYGAGGMKINMVNNYYKPGPATTTDYRRAKIITIDKDITSSNPTDDFYKVYNLWGKFYINGNYFDTSTSTSSTGLSYLTSANNDNWTYGVYPMILSSYGITQTEKDQLRLATPLPFGEIYTHTAQEAYEKVLTYSGCSKKRDSYDLRIVDETRNGTAAYKGLSKYNGLNSVTYPAGTVIGSTVLTVETTINWKSSGYPKNGIIDSQTDIKPANALADWSPWPTLNSTAAPIDTDSDGMPDAWETAHGLNPNSSSDAQLTTIDGTYPNVEVYLYSLVAEITNNQTITSILTPKEQDVKPKIELQGNTLKVLYPEQVKSIRIYNCMGMMQKTINESAVSLSDIATGVYFVQILSVANVTSTVKFIKP